MWYCKTNNDNTKNTACKTTGMAIRKNTSALKFYVVIVLLCIAAAAHLPAKGKIDEELAKEYFEIAQAYADLSKYDKAVSFYLKAAANPAHKNAAEYNLARVYGLQGDWKRARPILEQQYQEAPGNLIIQKAFIYSLVATGEEERACEMYKTIYDADSENPESALNYVRILIHIKRYEEAAALIETLKTRFTENTEQKTIGELAEKIQKALQPPPEDKNAPQEKAAAAKEAASQ